MNLKKIKLLIGNQLNSSRLGKVRGPRTPSIGKIKLPAVLGTKNVMIETDIVDADIPMLLSKTSLKNARALLDFDSDTAVMFGEKITLIATASGHYAVPLTVARYENQAQQQIALVTRIASKVLDDDTNKVAEKLHRQFCHCSANRLIKLVQLSQLWNKDRERQIVESISKVSSSCITCKRFKRVPPVPVVSLPLASQFNEIVAMDLIVVTHGTYVLHLIDMFTRYSVACVRYSKKQDVIADAIMKIWFSYFGRPRKFLAEIGGEFANATYSDMCETFGIESLKTAAESSC
jgi:hypothetical protein